MTIRHSLFEHIIYVYPLYKLDFTPIEHIRGVKQRYVSFDLLAPTIIVY